MDLAARSIYTFSASTTAIMADSTHCSASDSIFNLMNPDVARWPVLQKRIALSLEAEEAENGLLLQVRFAV
jgi:hypothetical protein